MTRPSTRQLVKRFALVIAPLLVVHSALAQTVKDDVGYTALLNQMGEDTPNGAGVTIGIIEPAFAGRDNPDLTAWLPNLTYSNPKISHVTLIDASGGSTFDSGHSSEVSKQLFGLNSGLATGITEAYYYDLSDFLFNKLVPLTDYVGTTQPSAFFYSLGNKVFQNQINNISAISTGSENNGNFLRRFDWATAHEDVINLVSAGNTSLSPALFSSSYNSIYIGITTGTSGKRTTNIDNIYNGLRQRPDVVTPIRNTSYGTAAASSITSVLLETARDPTLTFSNSSRSNTLVNTRHAEKPEVMKALLMAGAERETNNTVVNDFLKDENGVAIRDENGAVTRFIRDITNYRAAGFRTDNGLDFRYGAGQANVFNSYQILTAGEQDSREDGGNTSVSLFGFDYDEAFGNGAGDNNPNSVASYQLPTLNSDANFNITLAWNLDVYSGDGLFINALLYDLDLWLYDVTGDSEELVNASASSLANTETISQLLLAGRDYEFRVTSEKNVTALLWDYGIAWRTELLDVASANLDIESDDLDLANIPVTLADLQTQAVPVPAAGWLFVGAILCLFGLKRATPQHV